ncbi:hypothetical protein CfE428DRAFT_5660 [Chthoniobacter flavus Ellin428]|uniref:Uncharacterized protein n=1 Tax=Chthoniobacter flavus Ellin428 TaxID=497964 RepID=B4D9S0_9BACT|nr:hypothetical protein CfE428DRAFT_5660 [Chthoniobacter flavus Ellin428]
MPSVDVIGRPQSALADIRRPPRGLPKSKNIDRVRGMQPFVNNTVRAVHNLTYRWIAELRNDSAHGREVTYG